MLEAGSRFLSRAVTNACESRTTHVLAANKFGICVVWLEKYRQQGDGKKAFPNLPFLPSGISMMIMVIARNTRDCVALGTGRSMPSTAFLTNSNFVYIRSSKRK